MAAISSVTDDMGLKYVFQKMNTWETVKVGKIPRQYAVEVSRRPGKKLRLPTFI